mgnify:CR=1 FL=1
MGAGKRLLTGESLFMTVFQNRGQGKKKVAFAAPYPGKIIPVHLATLGGEVEIVARGLPPGIGSFAQWNLRLDGLLAQALMSIPSVKAVALGSGFDAGRLRVAARQEPGELLRRRREVGPLRDDAKARGLKKVFYNKGL